MVECDTSDDDGAKYRFHLAHFGVCIIHKLRGCRLLTDEMTKAKNEEMLKELISVSGDNKIHDT
jgi:hypothetical protein